MLEQRQAQLANALRKLVKPTQYGQGSAGELSVGRPLTHDVAGHPDTLKKTNHGDPYTFDDLPPAQLSPITGNSKCPKVQEGIAPPPLPPPRYIEDLPNDNDLGWQWSPLPTPYPVPLKRSRSRDSSPSAQKKGKFGFNRKGSASSLDFWSGSRRHSRAGSVVSSMNNSSWLRSIRC